jgi:TPR repeat protein
MGSLVALGVCYQRGWGGLLADRQKAADSYAKAAELGSASGQYCLGDCFRFFFVSCILL